jgi:DNA-directed RNA polymerase subunit RPC12/RpoP
MTYFEGGQYLCSVCHTAFPGDDAGYNDAALHEAACLKKDKAHYVHCSVCGKRVSNRSTEELTVRAWVECPECLGRGRQHPVRSRESADNDQSGT